MGLSNPVPGASITQQFGYTGLRSNGPFTWHYNGAYYASGFHTGIDLAAADGTIVRNVQYGVVYVAAWNGCGEGGCWGQGGGYVVIVKHNSTPVFTSHAHMKALYVTPGQPVYKGQPLGLLDTQGYASGPHDHHSLWVRGLWPTVNRAYPLNPVYYWDGQPGAGSSLVVPAHVRIGAGVNLRSGPGTNYSINQTTDRNRYPAYFKTVIGGAVAGSSDRRWHLVWERKWAWVWAPLATMLKTVASDEEVERVEEHALRGTISSPLGGTELTSLAPGPYEGMQDLAEPEGRHIRSSQSALIRVLREHEEVGSI